MAELLCIVCPNSCRLTAALNPDGSVEVSGHGCKRGIGFAAAELTNPTRTLTTTVRTAFPSVPVLPVRTDGEIPKGELQAAMKIINSLIIREPIGCGDTILEDLMGCRLIATSDVLKHLNN